MGEREISLGGGGAGRVAGTLVAFLDYILQALNTASSLHKHHRGLRSSFEAFQRLIDNPLEARYHDR